jgi:hypothetical protein
MLRRTPLRLPGITVLTALALALAPGAAHAASLSSAPQLDAGGKPTKATEVSFRAEPGEANRLIVGAITTGGSFQSVTFHDEGTFISAGKGCVSNDLHTATCSAAALSRPVIVLGSSGSVLASSTDATVIAGKGGDFIDATTAPGVSALGGVGKDTVFGSRAADNIAGGPGDDVLLGNGGDDLISGDGGRDEIQCGPGRQTASVDGFDFLRPPAPTDLTVNRDAPIRFDTDCEQLFFSAPRDLLFIAVNTARIDHGQLVFTQHTPQHRGSITLHADGGRVLASGPFNGERTRLTLTKAGRNALVPGSRQFVRFTVKTGRAPEGSSKVGAGVRLGLTLAPR